MQTHLITGEKTPEQIESLREGGRILAKIYAGLRRQTLPGVTQKQANDWVAKEIIRHGATATYLTSEVNFPGVICISVNDKIVHGIPDDTPFEVGDVVSYDLVITYKGMKTDSAFTMVVGQEPTGAIKHLLRVTERSLYAGIDAISGDGTRVGDISEAVERVLRAGQLGVIRELVGHGVGFEMHMDPDVPNYGRKGTGPILHEGDTIAIEPMATLGSERVTMKKGDPWGYYSKDGSLSAHYEHTVLITKTGAEILTQG